MKQENPNRRGHMNRFLISIASAISFVSTIHQVTAQNTPWYIGGSVGHQSANISEKKGILLGDGTQTSHKIGGNAIAGSLFAGYGKVCGAHNIYLGLEAFVGLSSLRAQLVESYGLTQITVSADLKESFGISIKAGVLFNSLLSYVKIGGLIGHWRYKSHWQLAGVADKIVNQYAPGLEAGLGVEAPLKQNLWIGIDYAVSLFRRTSFSHFSLAGTELSRHKISPQVNTLTLRMSYRF